MIPGKKPGPGPFTASQNPRSQNPMMAKSAANTASPSAAICREPKYFICAPLLFLFQRFLLQNRFNLNRFLLNLS